MKHSLRTALSLLLFVSFLLPLLSLTVAFSSCSSSPPADKNAVTSVTLNGDTITVKAVLTAGFLESYSEKKVYLFEIPSAYSTAVDLEELNPTAETNPKSEIKFELAAYDGVRSRLYSTYLIASYDGATRRYTALTTPVALSNPEAAATVAADASNAELSVKGLISDYPADAVRLGIAHTVVDVPMEEFILPAWKPNALAYLWNGETAYLNGEAVEKLDETVKLYTAARVQVYLRFTLSASETAPAGLYAGEAAKGAKGYAVDMSTPFAAGIMEGFFNFMADRYATPEDDSLPVTAFIIGYRVNDAATYANAGNMTLTAYITNYEKLVRLAHTALVSHNANGRVYISLDSHRSAADMAGGWDIPTFLSAFREEAALRGDYDWHLACELYSDSSTVWVENTAVDANYFTARNLSTLTDLLISDKYRTPDGEHRRFLISGLTIPAAPASGAPESAKTDEYNNNQAASYAYTYMTAVANGHIEALIYSAYSDADAPYCGLWQTDADRAPANQRPLYAVFQKMDTTHAADLSTALSAIVGASYTKLESALAGSPAPVTRVTGLNEKKSFEPEHKKAAPLFTFDGGSLHGFGNAGNLTYMELTGAETLGTVILHARFDRTEVCEPMGITLTLPATDLIGGKELLLDLYAGPLSSTADTANNTVTLRLTRAAKGAASAGDGEIIYESTVSDIKGTVWQTAVFAISDFTACLDASDEVTLTILTDSPDALSHNLGLAGVYITGNTASNGPSAGLIIAIVIIAILAVGGAVAFLYIRNSRKKY